MESIKAIFWKPDPEAQKRKCNALVRSNVRQLDKDIQNLRNLESKTKLYIVQASARAQRSRKRVTSGSSQTNSTNDSSPRSVADEELKRAAFQESSLLAREMIRVRRQAARLQTSKAQLQSVQMQVNEAFSVRKIEGSIHSSTGIIRDVNSLIRLPELTDTMRELSQELVKAGIIEEMVGDNISNLDDSDLLAKDEETEAEIEKILSEILKERPSLSTVQPIESVQPQSDLSVGGVLAQAQQLDAPLSSPNVFEQTEPDDAQQEEMLQQMRGRLEALKG